MKKNVPSAPKMVQSNPNYAGAPREIQVPFGAGNIGFANHIVANNNNNAPYPVPSQSHTAPYPNIPNQLPTSINIPNQIPQQQQQVKNFPSTQNQNYQQQPAFNIYPNLNQHAPFSYTNPQQPQFRSTSDFMRQVIELYNCAVFESTWKLRISIEIFHLIKNQ